MFSEIDEVSFLVRFWLALSGSPKENNAATVGADAVVPFVFVDCEEQSIIPAVGNVCGVPDPCNYLVDKPALLSNSDRAPLGPGYLQSSSPSIARLTSSRVGGLSSSGRHGSIGKSLRVVGSVGV